MSELEQALLRRCADDAGLAVYVDWLVEQGGKATATPLMALLRHPRVEFRGGVDVVVEERRATLLCFGCPGDEGDWVVLPAAGADGDRLRHPRLDGPLQIQQGARSPDGHWLFAPVAFADQAATTSPFRPLPLRGLRDALWRCFDLSPDLWVSEGSDVALLAADLTRGEAYRVEIVRDERVARADIYAVPGRVDQINVQLRATLNSGQLRE